MVVISEDDIICRGCATLINTLDRLETEMGTVRGVVLRFLEKKYALEEGELVNSKPSGAPAPPPQITPSANPSKLNVVDAIQIVHLAQLIFRLLFLSQFFYN